MAAMEWIKCSDRLPEKDGPYLVYRAGYVQTVWTCDFSTDLNTVLHDEYDEEGELIDFGGGPHPGWWETEYEGYDGYYREVEVYGITHWMPLPEPPTI